MSQRFEAHALVVGFGSIGQRHARILADLGCTVAVVTRRPFAGLGYTSIRAALAAQRFDYVVIASATCAHAGDLAELAAADFRGRVLVEKPLVAQAAELVRKVPEESVFVGYNLRFHPMVRALEEALAGRRLLTASFHVGQRLDAWRPDRDYKSSYSATKSGGGGVLRDLSHELDMVLHLVGQWAEVSASIGNTGSLGIETEDYASLMLECEGCRSVLVHLNYLHRRSIRRFILETETSTIVADLGRGVLVIDDTERTYRVERDDTYRAQHIAVLSGDTTRVCSYRQGAAVVDLIDFAEQAAVSGQRQFHP